MSRLFLITGFLGSGKTTFLRQLLPLFQGEKLRLIVNEFGKENVDGALLADLRAMQDEISGGSIFCSCRMDQFEKTLSRCGADETIVVEASGMSDPTGVRRLFSQTDRFPQIRYMGGICLVDAVRFPKVYATTRTCVRQIAASDLVLLNKTDLASPEQLQEVRTLLLGQRPDIPILETSFARIPPDFLNLFLSCKKDGGTPLPEIADLTLQRLTVQLSGDILATELRNFVEMFAEDTFRVKGLIHTADCGLVLVDCVTNVVSVTPSDLHPSEQGNLLTVLSGAKMPMRKAVRHACNWYSKYVISVE